MIKALKHGNSLDLQQVGDSLALYDPHSQVHTLALCKAEDLDGFVFQEPVEVMLLIGHAHLQQVMERFGFTSDMACYQGVMLETKPFELSGALEVRRLTPEYGQEVQKRYSLKTGEDLAVMTAQGRIFGAFKEGVWIGFIGFHDEGSMGMLEIFSDHQRQGYGEYLEKWLINYELAQGNLPYGHVITSNEPSLAMQKKLGFTFYPDTVHWLW